MYDIIVIGAGLAGTLAALELAKTHTVLLIESGSTVIPPSSSSRNECYKYHTGMHYLGDKKTAEYCLIKAIEFARKYPDFITGKNDLNAPWRRGRHYILASSLVSPKEAKKIAQHLSNLYKQKVQEDPLNKVFGEPENFIIELNPEQYNFISQEIPYYNANHNLQTTHVALAYETAESQLDIHAFQKFLQQEVEHNSNITFVPNTWVTHINYKPEQFGYQVSVKTQKQETLTYEASSLVNCAWQNIEVLEKQTEHFVHDNTAINRVKLILLVKLPEALLKINTGIFSSGPFFSITNLGNGYAILTSERLTNIGHYQTGTKVPKHLEQLIKQYSSENPKSQEIAKQIITDCANCFQEPMRSQFLQTELVKIQIGFVKMMNIKEEYSYDSIYNKESAVHSRQEDGVQHKTLGYISNSAMKMTYAPSNADKVAKQLNEDLKLIKKYREFVNLTLIKVPEHKLNKTILNVLWRERIITIITQDITEKELKGQVGIIAKELITHLEKRQELFQEMHKKTFFDNTNSKRRDQNSSDNSLKFS